jgi:N-acetyl-gamma-glutamyl-phosphate reductase
VAAKESVSLVENENTIIIDASTAHRTEEGWAYGFPELSEGHKEAIKNGKRIAVPGCYATGFISLVYPMIAEGIMPADYPVTAFGLSGYSGAGKKVIAAYEAEERPTDFDAPREYALTQSHKHLKEMKKISGLTKEPCFSPIICDYYSGMVMSVPVYTELLSKAKTLEEVHQMFTKFYEGQQFVKVMPLDAEAGEGNMLAGNGCSGWDGLKIFITGNDERIVLSSQFDNLGKGASGAAIQRMNVVLGCAEDKGLQL